MQGYWQEAFQLGSAPCGQSLIRSGRLALRLTRIARQIVPRDLPVGLGGPLPGDTVDLDEDAGKTVEPVLQSHDLLLQRGITRVLHRVTRHQRTAAGGRTRLIGELDQATRNSTAAPHCLVTALSDQVPSATYLPLL